MSELGYSSELLPAEQLLQSLQGLVNMVKIYQANNQLVVKNIQKLVKAAEALLEGNEGIVIHLENGSFFINEQKLMRRKGGTNILENFYNFLADRAVPGFRIRAAVSTASLEDLTGFAGFLNHCGDQPEPATWIENQLLKSQISWISVLPPDESFVARKVGSNEQEENREEKTTGRRLLRNVYIDTLMALRDVTEKVVERKRFSLPKVEGMVQKMVDTVMDKESTQLLAMSTVRDYQDIILTHSVNVTILSLYIGRELGLPEDVMENLGICAIFHDLGKCVIPDELLFKTDSLTTEEIEQIRGHSMDSVRLVLQLMAAPVGRKAAIMVSAFEHHLQVDHHGYPDIGWHKAPELFSKIIAVADAYDALTSSRVYRYQPMSGDRALGLMFKGAGSVFDPLVLKVFVRLLGVYPIGTILEFGNGRKAMVSGVPSSSDLTRPVIRFLEVDDSVAPETGKQIDLAGSETDTSLGEIVESYHPAVYNIQPARFLT